jgi:hypothetical protein
MSVIPELPPNPLSPDGSPRRVGVEIEYAGPLPAEVAAMVRDLFGGTAEFIDPHCCRIGGTRLGDFTVELDMSAAHPKQGDDSAKSLVDDVMDRLRTALGDVGSLIIPYEISTPPLPIAQLAEADRLVDGLRRLGAKGTKSSPFYAFGLHFNPEVAAYDAAYVLDHLKAYLLLSSWLRAEIQVDLTRRLAPFIAEFPTGYAVKVVDPAYRPDLDRLIDDYLQANPSRNRELDLYPLFVCLDPDRLARHADDMHVKPRPTFHYRLPNSRIREPDASVVTEWNRWVQVERLAADRAKLDAMGQAYIDRAEWGELAQWPAEVARWIEP